MQVNSLVVSLFCLMGILVKRIVKQVLKEFPCSNLKGVLLKSVQLCETYEGSASESSSVFILKRVLLKGAVLCFDAGHSFVAGCRTRTR